MAIATTTGMRAPSGVSAGPVQCRSGNNYTIDANGFVANVLFVDVPDLMGAGFVVSALEPDRTNQLLGTLKGANFNITTDQAVALSLFGLAAAGTKCYVDKIIVANASVSLTTAAGGFYSAASKGGSAIVAAGQAYSGLTAATLAIELTIGVRLVQSANPPVIFFSLTTGQGSAATADIYVFGAILG